MVQLELLSGYSFHPVHFSIICHRSHPCLHIMTPLYLVFLPRSLRLSADVKLRQKMIIICISTLGWKSSHWEMNMNIFWPIICQIDVGCIERNPSGHALSLWPRLWDWELQQTQFEFSYCRTVWPCLDAHFAIFFSTEKPFISL